MISLFYDVATRAFTPDDEWAHFELDSHSLIHSHSHAHTHTDTYTQKQQNSETVPIGSFPPKLIPNSTKRLKVCYWVFSTGMTSFSVTSSDVINK